MLLLVAVLLERIVRQQVEHVRVAIVCVGVVRSFVVEVVVAASTPQMTLLIVVRVAIVQAQVAAGIR